MGFAPEATETLISLIMNLKKKNHMRKDAIRDYFQILEKGVAERKVKETMPVTLEKLAALEGGRDLNI